VEPFLLGGRATTPPASRIAARAVPWSSALRRTFKFARWLDLVFLQRLPGSGQPPPA